MEWEEFQKRNPWSTSDSMVKKSLAAVGYQGLGGLIIYAAILAPFIVIAGIIAMFE